MGGVNFLFVTCVFLGFVNNISCRINGNVNISIAKEFFDSLPKDGVSFFKRFAQTLEDVEDYGECAEQIGVLLRHPDQALQMFDAWAKPPAGIMWVTPEYLGSFDECVDIDIQEKGQIRVQGKHCANGLVIPWSTDASKFTTDSFKLSYCIPHKCNKTHIINALMQIAKLPSTVEPVAEHLILENFCSYQGDQSDWSAGAIATSIILAIIVFLMLTSTLYDAYLFYNEQKPYHPLCLTFSVYSNGKKLVHVATNKASGDQILVFHGIKFIGMLWIMAAHNGTLWAVLPMDNYAEAQAFLKKPYLGYLQTAHLAVDSFFFISGFLLAYLYLKSAASAPAMKQIAMIPSSILHRYLRLTPALLIVYLCYTYLTWHLESGPLKNGALQSNVDACTKHWWAVFLYLQNYANRHNLCMTNLWYVAADMQMYVFAPLVLIPIAVQYKRKGQFKLVMIELVVLSIISAVIPLFIKLQFKEYDPNLDEYDTHSRIVDYIMGITLGVFIRHGKHKLNISAMTNVLLWIITLSAMFICVVLNEAAYLSDDYIHRSIYLSVMRPTWCLGLSYVIWACVNGKGGIINWFLSCGTMQVGSRLTYAIYLVHGEVIAYCGYQVRDYWHLNNFNLFYTFSGVLIVSLIVSAFLSLGFESPMITIEKFIFGKSPRPPPKTDNNQPKNGTHR